MSNSLLAKATQALKAKMEAGKKLRAEHKHKDEILFAGVGTLGGNVAAAMVDTKLGKNNQPHKLFAKADGSGGLPTNIAVGAIVAVPALLIKKMPGQAAVVCGGLSMAGAGLYRYICDRHAANPPASGQ